MIILSLTMSEPLGDLFGWGLCDLYYSLLFVYFTASQAGGFLMALYRYMIIKMPTLSHCMIGLNNLAVIMLGFQATLMSVAWWLYSERIKGVGFSPTQELCLGFSQTMSQVVWLHSGGSQEAKANAMIYINGLVFIWGLLVVGEMLLYLLITWDIYHHNSMCVKKGVLSLDMAMARNRKNVVTLTGIHTVNTNCRECKSIYYYQARY